MTNLSIMTYFSGQKPEPEPCQVSDLTARQKEVLHLVSKGMTNVEIGEELGISPVAVKHAKARCLDRLGEAQYRHEVYRRG